MADLLGTIISAGANLAGSLFEGSEQRAASEELYDKQERFQKKWNRRQWDLAKRGMRISERPVSTVVADARRAGIHPLYAMGAAGGSSPSFSAGGPPRVHPSGSGLGTGIARAGQILGEGISARRKAPTPLEAATLANMEAQTEAFRSQGRRNDAEAYAAASEAKRAEQKAASTGRDAETFAYNPRAPIPRKALSAATGRPKGTRPEKRPVEVFPHADISPRGTATFTDPDGVLVTLPWYGDESGFDEIGQVLNAWELAKSRARYQSRSVKRWYERKIRRIRREQQSRRPRRRRPSWR